VRWETARDFLADLHEQTGLPVYITEYDISTTDDNAQLAACQEHVSHFLETDYVAGITIWGWIVGATWSLAPDSGLVRSGSPRPAMTWLMETLGRPVP
jgi:GH35 family endo-1,4-beta-xylanase